MAESLPVDARQFVFKGNAKEWFGIWIVNLLLSIVTLGIYSAWAKVRTKKYFYNNTFADDRNFDYHATGKQILIGRLIVIGAVILFQIIVSLAPVVGGLLVLAMLVGFPWLLVRSIAFNARMTSFSNVRFGFTGGVGKAFLVYLLYPFLTALTLYTTFPILDRAMKRYSINNHKLGGASFNIEIGLTPFYKALGVAILWIVVVGVGGALITGFSFLEFSAALENMALAPEQALPTIIMFYVLFFAAFLPAMFIYQAMTRNAVYNHTSLEGGHRLASNVTPQKLLWIALSNMVVVICTLGLMLPWAQVRMTRYLADHTGFIPGSSLDEFVSQQQAAGHAIGDAFTDLESIDVGLPI